MARNNQEQGQEEEKRQAALKILKGNVPALAFAYLTQEEGRPFGQQGLMLGYNIFNRYLYSKDVEDFLASSLQESERKAIEEGLGLYSGSVNSARLVRRAYSITFGSLNSVTLGDLSGIIGFKVRDELKNRGIGDLNREGANEDEKKIYKAVIADYQSFLVQKYMSEALQQQREQTRGDLEKIVA